MSGTHSVLIAFNGLVRAHQSGTVGARLVEEKGQLWSPCELTLFLCL
jgi:hypothetical protein